MSLNAEINKILGPDLIKKIKALKQTFAGQVPAQPAAPAAPAAPNPAQEQVALQEAPLADGTILKYNTPTLAVGSEVTIVSPEGELPAPAGELTLQDGTKIVVVSQEGKSVVESVTPGSGAPAAPVQQEAAPDLNAKILEIASLLKGFEDQLKAEKAENEKLKKEVAEAQTKFSALEKNVGEFIGVFSAVLEMPTAEPIEAPKNKKQRPIYAWIALADKKQTQK